MRLDSNGAVSEEALIHLILAACPCPPSPFGPGDDAAILPPSTSRRVVTTDAMIEGVHFFPRHPAADLGWKALAVNLSDVAAMGATPGAFLMSLAAPPRLGLGWWRGFARGLAECARRGGVECVGGDTVRSDGPLMISVTAWGSVGPAGPLLRQGGRPDDVLMVCGPVGRSASGFKAWSRGAAADDARVRWHLRPEPDLAAGAWAVAHGATAGMDLSDGMKCDLPRLAQASGLRLVVDLDRLPADEGLASEGVSAEARVLGGEDYGLVVLVPPDREEAFASRGFVTIGWAAARQTGRATEVPHVLWRSQGAEHRFSSRPFTHFGED